MPVPVHNLLTWSGVFGSSASPTETWQFSLKTPLLGTGTPAADANAPHTATMTSAFTSNLAALFASYVVLTRVQSVQVEETGKWAVAANGAYVRSEATVNVPGTTSTGPVYPYQIATCVSLVTARAGATGKGRFYLPAVYYPLSGFTGLMSTGNGSSIALAAKNFLNALAPVTGAVRVFSSKGYSTPVTAVKVGLALDTQRRRRGDLNEGYVSQTL